MDDPRSANKEGDVVSIPYVRGANFPKYSRDADTFEQMKEKATAWLRLHAETKNMVSSWGRAIYKNFVKNMVTISF